MDSPQKTEILTITRPESWSEADWNALSPTQRAMYATNPSLYRPGQSGRDEQGKRPPGRPRKDGLPAGSVVPSQTAQLPTDAAPVVSIPTFEVTEAESIAESLEVNGLALVNDAYTRAARASSSGDPFDRAVYLTLLGKAHPMAMLGAKTKALSGEAKRKKKLLEALLAAHAEGLGVQDASFTPVKESED